VAQKLRARDPASSPLPGPAGPSGSAAQRTQSQRVVQALHAAVDVELGRSGRVERALHRAEELLVEVDEGVSEVTHAGLLVSAPRSVLISAVFVVMSDTSDRHRHAVHSREVLWSWESSAWGRT